MSTVFFVSWNGATEVKCWDFYVTNNLSIPFEKIGTVVQSKFETSFMAKGFWAYAYAEARDSEGGGLRMSAIATVGLPDGFPQQYDNLSLAIEAGSLNTRPQSPAGGNLQISVALCWFYVVVGICTVVLALIGLQVTLKSIFRRLTRSCDGRGAADRSLNLLTQQTEGLLRIFLSETGDEVGQDRRSEDSDEEDGVS